MLLGIRWQVLSWAKAFLKSIRNWLNEKPSRVKKGVKT
jgi:hypothetical protein